MTAIANLGTLLVDFKADSSKFMNDLKKVEGGLLKTERAADKAAKKIDGDFNKAFKANAQTVQRNMPAAVFAVGALGGAFGDAGNEMQKAFQGASQAAMAFAVGGPVMGAVAAASTAITAFVTHQEAGLKRLNDALDLTIGQFQALAAVRSQTTGGLQESRLTLATMGKDPIEAARMRANADAQEVKRLTDQQILLTQQIGALPAGSDRLDGLKGELALVRQTRDALGEQIGINLQIAERGESLRIAAEAKAKAEADATQAMREQLRAAEELAAIMETMDNQAVRTDKMAEAFRMMSVLGQENNASVMSGSMTSLNGVNSLTSEAKRAASALEELRYRADDVKPQTLGGLIAGGASGLFRGLGVSQGNRDLAGNFAAEGFGSLMSGGANAAGMLGLAAGGAGALLGGPIGAEIGSIIGESIGKPIDRLASVFEKAAETFKSAAGGLLGGTGRAIGGAAQVLAGSVTADPASAVMGLMNILEGAGDVGNTLVDLAGKTKAAARMQEVLGKADAVLIRALEPLIEGLIPLAPLFYDFAVAISPLLKGLSILTDGIGLLYDAVANVVNFFDQVVGGSGNQMRTWAEQQAQADKLLEGPHDPKAAYRKRIAEEKARAERDAADAAKDLAASLESVTKNLPTGFRVGGPRYGSESITNGQAGAQAPIIIVMQQDMESGSFMDSVNNALRRQNYNSNGRASAANLGRGRF